MGRFINLVGSKHIHDLPSVVEYGAPLGKMHKGSIWQCNCGETFEWSGRKWEQ